MISGSEMDAHFEFGVSKRGKRTLIYNNFEFWHHKDNSRGDSLWRCSKFETFKCKARVRTNGNSVKSNPTPEHTHMGNVSSALARQAVGQMKNQMTETLATPSASQGAVVVHLPGHVQMALPKRSSLSRVLRRHRFIKSMTANVAGALPPLPTDCNFLIPERFRDFLLHDSGQGAERQLVFGDRELVTALGRAELWIADGTFKVVPTLFFQLYSIHFEFVGGLHPAAVYCLLCNKNRASYDRILRVIHELIPNATPRRILIDFESAAMNAFRESYPQAEVTGCYFHLCQSLNRKINDVGLKSDYETDTDISGFIRCLAALSHVPPNDVVNGFETLVQEMPANEKVNDVVTYFEQTYIRGRRRPGRGDNYGPAIFPIPTWNQFDVAGEGIARTTNSVEGWHHSLQALFMCQHPTMWTFLAGIQRDCQLSKASYLQATTGVVHVGKKTYRDLKARVQRAVGAYGRSDLLTYLRAIAHLSHT
jgi:hypothetical protein